eukprot:scaffold42141_cov30-Tisochrysis_lutea.AAC.3
MRPAAAGQAATTVLNSLGSVPERSGSTSPRTEQPGSPPFASWTAWPRQGVDHCSPLPERPLLPAGTRLRLRGAACLLGRTHRKQSDLIARAGRRAG